MRRTHQPDRYIVLGAQPPAQRHRCVSVERPIRLAESAYRKVVLSTRGIERDRPPAFRLPIVRPFNMAR